MAQFHNFIQNRLTHLIENHPLTEQWHIFKDKLREKTVISQLGIPTARLYKVFENPDELNLSFLPSSFVIKLTYQSRGRGVICIKDGIDQSTEKPFDIDNIRQTLKKHMLPKGTFVTHQKVMIEELLEAEVPNTPLLDIKLFYVAGTLLFLQIIDPTKRPPNRIYPRFHYTPNWQRVPIHKQEAPLDQHMQKPKYLDKIINYGNTIAHKLFPNTFIRLDFYPTNKGPVFGETTLVPNLDCTDSINICLSQILRENKITL